MRTEWILPSLAVLSFVGQGAITIYVVWEMKKIVNTLRSRSHRHAGLLQFLFMHSRLMWNKLMDEGDFPDFPNGNGS